jgi:hypothetical protein
MTASTSRVAPFAWLGFALSLLIHLATFTPLGGLTLPVAPFFSLHIAAIVIGIYTILGLSRSGVPFYRLLSSAPIWSRLLLGVAVVYGSLNFTLLLPSGSQGSTLPPHLELRLFSGHWIFFFLAAAVVLQFPPEPVTRGSDSVHRASDLQTPTLRPPFIRMWIRMLAVVVIFIGGAFAFVFDAAMTRRWGIPGPVWMLIWLGAITGLQFLILRCPHCRKLASRRPGGWHSPFVGSACPWCKGPY